MCAKTLEIGLDRLPRVPQRLVSSGPLGDATRQGRSAGDERAVLVDLDQDPELQGAFRLPS